MIKQKFEILQSISHNLMLHSSFINNIGLLKGKMGIAIFFYHYYNYTKKEHTGSSSNLVHLLSHF